MSEAHANSIAKMAQQEDDNIDYNQYKTETTFVPFDVAMAMKEQARNRDVCGIIDNDVDDEGNLLPEYNKKLKRI